MDTGMAFQEHAVTSLNAVVEKYFQNAVSGHVTLEKADSGFTVNTRVALSRRMELESTGRAVDAHAAAGLPESDQVSASVTSARQTALSGISRFCSAAASTAATPAAPEGVVRS